MGKQNEMIVQNSGSDNDSLSLIDPVIHLSLEHIDKRITTEDLDDQSKKFEKLGLNDSNKKEENISKRKKLKKRCRDHPYLHLNKSKKDSIHNQNVKRLDNKHKTNYNIKFLKSLGYIEYSSSKESKSMTSNNDIRSLYTQLNNSLNETFSKYLSSVDRSKKTHYVCNRRSH